MRALFAKNGIARGGWLIGLAAAVWAAFSACAASGSDSTDASKADDAGAMAGSAGAPHGGSGGALPDAGEGGDAWVEAASGSGGQGGSGNYITATPTIHTIHASPNLFSFRLCVEESGSFVTKYPFPHDADHHMPGSNLPGVAPGDSVDLEPVASALSGTTDVTLYALRATAQRVAQATPELKMDDCQALLEGSNPLDDEDFVAIEGVSLGDPDFAPVRALVLSGCVADESDPALSTTLCGADFDETNDNLGFQLVESFPKLLGEPTTMQMYVVHVSPSLSAMQPEQKLELSYVDTDEDTGDSITSDVPLEDPTTQPFSWTPPADIAGYGVFGFELVAKESANVADELLTATLSDVQRVSSPYTTPDVFFTGANGFLIVFVGDATGHYAEWLTAPGEWNGDFDGRGLHAVAIPFNFEIGS